MATKIVPERLSLTSEDTVANRLQILAQLFPEAVTEGLQIDFDRLRQLLGDFVDSRPERYGLSWAGRSAAVRATQTVSTGTLLPMKDDSENWDSAQNLIIEGENLEVLKLLQKSYHEAFKLIYIDPPYNSEGDLIYKDNFKAGLKEYLRYSGQVTEEGVPKTSEIESRGRYHSQWLTLMYPRLRLAKNLMADNGVLFCSIDSKEFANLFLVLANEVFGEENYLGTIVWKGATDNNPTQIAVEHEYILVFAKHKPSVAPVWKNRSVDAKQSMLAEYRRLRELHGDDVSHIRREFRQFVRENADSLQPLTHYNRVDSRGVYTGSRKVHNPKPGGYEYDVVHPDTGEVYRRPANGYRYPPDTMAELLRQRRILFPRSSSQIVQVKEYLEDYEGKLSSVIHLDSRAGSNELEALFGERKIFPNPKPVALLKHLFDFCLEDGDAVLDFFAGSGSTGDAVLRLNQELGGRRRFVLIQLPEGTPPDSAPRRAGYEKISEITRDRIRRVIADMSPEQEGEDAASEDLGFRALRLSASNFRLWNAEEAPVGADELAAQLRLHISHVVDGRSQLDVLLELLLKSGFPLTAGIEELTLNDQTVFSVSGGQLLICLEDGLQQTTIREIIEREPQQVICFDHAFGGNDSLKTNTVLEMKSHDIQFRTV